MTVRKADLAQEALDKSLEMREEAGLKPIVFGTAFVVSAKQASARVDPDGVCCRPREGHDYRHNRRKCCWLPRSVERHPRSNRDALGGWYYDFFATFFGSSNFAK